MSVTRDDVICAARRWLRTPFRHQGRICGVGVDCVGLVIGVAKELGLSAFDTTEYGRIPDPRRMGELLREQLNEIRISDAQPGDVLWLTFSLDPQHLALVSDVGIIHAYAPMRRVVEHRIDIEWRGRVRAAFTIPGVI